ncbi:MAG: hypothetical protein H7832_06105 [Magnetococcus sp. DMHC-6]
MTIAAISQGTSPVLSTPQNNSQNVAVQGMHQLANNNRTLTRTARILPDENVKQLKNITHEARTLPADTAYETRKLSNVARKMPPQVAFQINATSQSARNPPGGNTHGTGGIDIVA